MHRTPQNRRGCTIIFWHSNALIQEVLAENAFCHEIATQVHSRSLSLQSVTGRQGAVYRHIIFLAVSLKFSKTYPPKSPKTAVVDNPNVVWRSHSGEPSRIFAWALYFQKLDSLAYIFVADSMGLSSFKFEQWAPKTHLFCDRVRFGRSRSFKVIQGQSFWYQSKAHIRLPISD